MIFFFFLLFLVGTLYAVIGTVAFALGIGYQVWISGFAWLYETPIGLCVGGLSVLTTYAALTLYLHWQKESFASGEELQRKIDRENRYLLEEQFSVIRNQLQRTIDKVDNIDEALFRSKE